MAEVGYSEEEDIEAPPEAVYEYRLDYEPNLPEYNPNVSNMQRIDEGKALGPGAIYSFDVDIPNMGQMPTTLTVKEALAPSRIVNEMGSGPIRARETCTFEPMNGGTRVVFDVLLTLPDELKEMGEMAERSGREQVRLELELMKKALEG